MMVLPRTQAPIAIFQLRPTAIMEEAMAPKYQYRCNNLKHIAENLPTSQFETAQASAIQ
jgi:hypothetical protein